MIDFLSAPPSSANIQFWEYSEFQALYKLYNTKSTLHNKL